MTSLERDIKALVLRVLLAANGEPVTEFVITSAVRNSFAHLAFTAYDLASHIRNCEEAGWIAGTKDELLGTVWTLTSKGKIRAQQLG